MQISQTDRDNALAFAKHLVRDHLNPHEAVRERLHRVGRELNVERIEPGATSSLGFLSQLENGKFAIYYAQTDGCSKARCNFTIAHELAHLVLDRFVPHIEQSRLVARTERRDTTLEQTVERIAAELLMPEALVIQLLRSECKKGRAGRGIVPRRRIIRHLCNQLGVSEQAMVFRLLEIPQLLSALFRIQDSDAVGNRRGGIQRRYSPHGGMRLRQSLRSVVVGVEEQQRKNWTTAIDFRTSVGDRSIVCDGWHRPVWTSRGKHFEYWLVGWTWNME
jgi:hypothetical protein